MLLKLKKDSTPIPLIWFNSGKQTLEIAFSLCLLRNHVPAILETNNIGQLQDFMKPLGKCIVVCGPSLTD